MAGIEVLGGLLSFFVALALLRRPEARLMSVSIDLTFVNDRLEILHFTPLLLLPYEVPVAVNPRLGCAERGVSRVAFR